MRASEIYSFSKFEVSNIVSLAVVAILYTRPPELTHLTAGSLYHLTDISPFPSPGNHHSPLCFCVFQVLFIFDHAACGILVHN